MLAAMDLKKKDFTASIIDIVIEALTYSYDINSTQVTKS